MENCQLFVYIFFHLKFKFLFDKKMYYQIVIAIGFFVYFFWDALENLSTFF